MTTSAGRPTNHSYSSSIQLYASGKGGLTLVSVSSKRNTTFPEYIEANSELITTPLE